MNIEELKSLWYNMGKEGIDITYHKELVNLFRGLDSDTKLILNQCYQRAKDDLDYRSADFKTLEK